MTTSLLRWPRRVEGAAGAPPGARSPCSPPGVGTAPILPPCTLERTPPPPPRPDPRPLARRLGLGAGRTTPDGGGAALRALTLPGLERDATNRGAVRLDDHIDAAAHVTRELARDHRVLVVGHSGGGSVAHGVVDRLPDAVARVVYVDSGPTPDGLAIGPGLSPTAEEYPLPSWAELEADENSTADLAEDQRAEFRRRAASHPADPVRAPLRLRDPGGERSPSPPCATP